ncbi:hypothetical protein [Castellaniella sp. MT123]|uniref:hypothetical protein n=1 Tax=Castellaniella sp. MT123 TaxID=3140381 RepID=UPI0031F440E1
MSAGLLMAEKMLMPLAIEMLQFSQRLQRGCWENWDIEAAQHLLNAVQRMPAPFTDGEDLSKHASACRVAAQWGGETQQAGQ